MKTLGLKMWVLFFSILFFDQVLKIYIKTNMFIGEEYVVFDWFRIYFVENNGFAFGLEFFGFWGKLFLTLFRIIFVFFVFRWLFGLVKGGVDSIVTASVLLVCAGAVGNILDSVFYGLVFDYAPLFFGRVVDMFYFPIFSGIYPDWIPYVGGDRFVFFRFIFNIADSSITVGAFLLLIFHNRIPVK